MKKVLLLLVVTSCTGMVSAHRDLERPQSENVQRTAHKDYLPQEEYNQVQEEYSNLQEYEQQVCDNAQPPHVSPMVAWMHEVGGNMLVKLIVLRETFQRYLAALKVMIENLFGCNNAVRSKK